MPAKTPSTHKKVQLHPSGNEGSTPSKPSQDASTMTPQEQLKRLEAELLFTSRSAVKEGRIPAAEDMLDPSDQAVLTYQKELLFRLGTSVTAQLALVRKALAKVEDGTFGECENCGNSIGDKRLNALPWTPLCIACQEKLEKGEISMPGEAA